MTTSDAPAPSYAFAFSPKWIASHILVGALIVTMVAACLWQLSRRAEVAERNEQIRARSEMATEPIEDLVPPNLTYADGPALEFRVVEATGTFDRNQEVLVRNRSYQGAPGSWTLTPLVLDDGRAVLVNRGWIPRSYEADASRPEVDPPTGEATVIGWVRPTEVRRGLNVADAPDGVLTSVARPDIVRLQRQIDYELLPVFIQAEAVEPSTGALPEPVGLPPLDGGPHLSYAMQWATFSLIAIVGYPMILRRVARGQAASAEE